MNIIEKLAREIHRVSKLREQYKQLDGMPGVNVRIAIAVMDAALEVAMIAAGSADISIVINATHDLEKFEK